MVALLSKNKNGLFYWIELILLVVVLLAIVFSLPQSKDGFLTNKDYADMQKLGFSTLQGLDNLGVLENYTNTTDFAGSNFTALAFNIRGALPNSTYANIEYFNGTKCFNESGSLLSICGNISRSKDTVLAEYSYAKLSNPITINLYLRRILG